MKIEIRGRFLVISALLSLSGCLLPPTPVPPSAPPVIKVPVAAGATAPTDTPTMSPLDKARTEVAQEASAKETAKAEATATELARAGATASAVAKMNAVASATASKVAADAATQAAQAAPSYVRLVNRHTQLCLTAQVGTRAIVQEPCGVDRPEQLWKWDGAQKRWRIDLESRSGICIGYNLGFGHDDNSLAQVGCSNQRPWTVYLVRWPGDPPPLKVAQHPHPTTTPLSSALDRAAYYYIGLSDGDCVDVEMWSHQDGQRIIHDPCHCPLQLDYDNQLWTPY